MSKVSFLMFHSKIPKSQLTRSRSIPLYIGSFTKDARLNNKTTSPATLGNPASTVIRCGMEFLHPAPDDDAHQPAKKTPYLDPYRTAFQSFGASFDTTLWKSRATQTVRFDVLLNIVDLNDLRILDAGCGLGDLGDYLIEKNINYRHYLGIDGLERMVEKAADKNLPRAEFRALDFVADPTVLAIGNPDVIFFSGSLNTIPEPTARKIIQSAFDYAQHAVVFNFLSDQCAREIRAKNTGPASRFATLDWLQWSLNLSANVIFRQDYLAGHDATIGILKPARTNS